MTSIPISCSRVDTHLKNNAYRSAMNAALQHVPAHGEHVPNQFNENVKIAIYMSVFIFVAVVGVDICVLLLI